ncbi:MAG: hypothetical protein ACLPWS_22845 [Rhodomicrobium sp.]
MSKIERSQKHTVVMAKLDPRLSGSFLFCGTGPAFDVTPERRLPKTPPLFAARSRIRPVPGLSAMTMWTAVGQAGP